MFMSRQNKLFRRALSYYLLGMNYPDRNRKDIYQGNYGVRIATFHETPVASLKQLDYLLNELSNFFYFPKIMSSLRTLEAINRKTSIDYLILTFDDGHADNFSAAELLWKKKIQGIFFVIPSFIGRTVSEYYAYHDRRQVIAHRFPEYLSHSRGLSKSQLLEMIAMGHIVGAHNYSHRDLGCIKEPKDLEYEIKNAIAETSEITGSRCSHFAIGFGHLKNVTDEAFRYLCEMNVEIYFAIRGLNILGGQNSCWFRDGVCLAHPIEFTLTALRGGLDHRYVTQMRALIDWEKRLGNSRGR